MLNQQYAIGLYWFYSPGYKHFCKENLGNLGFYSTHSSQGVLSKNKKDAGKVSLASLLSNRYDSLIYISDKVTTLSPSSAKGYWLCVVQNGIVVHTGTLLSTPEASAKLLEDGIIDAAPEMDITYSGDMITDKTELIEFLPYLKQIFKTLADEQEIAIGLDCDDHEIKDLFADLSSHIKDISIDSLSSQSAKQIRQSTLRSIKRNKKPVYIAMIIMLITAAAVGYHYYQAHQEAEKNAAEMRLKAMKFQQFQTVQQKTQYQQFLEDLEQRNAGFQLAGILTGMDKLTYQGFGWQLKMMQFEMQKNHVFTLKYQRQSYATLNNLLELNSSLHALRMDVANDANAANIYVNFDESSSADKADNDAIEQFKSAEARLISASNLISKLQSHDLKYTTTPLKSKQQNQPAKQVELTVAGSGLYQLMMLYHIAKTIPFLMISALNINFENTQINTWTFKGVIYE
ncbi:MAG: type 4b pilus protein PilO2 [Francisellaceae bacterium]